MNILLFNQILADKTIHSLCWMLIHSLWQGFLLTVLVGFIMVFTRQSQAVIRYNLLVASLLIFFMCIMGTGVYVFTNMENIDAQIFLQLFGKQTDSNFLNAQNQNILLLGIIDFLNQNAGIIVNIWLFFILFSCLCSVRDISSIIQIRRKKIASVEDFWEQRVRELSLKIQISKPVQFLQSGIAQVPMVVGHFKPVILFPIGLISAISAEEIEAILIHELAHIKRNDYLVNIFQRVLEVIFFFNPCIWWVSSLIKIERENCCDDFAISLTNNKRTYIQALVSFQEFHLQKPVLAMGFINPKNRLLKRVLRIVENKNKSLNDFEKTFVTFCLSILGAVVFMSFQVTEPVLQTKTVTTTTKKTTTTTTESTEEEAHLKPKKALKKQISIPQNTDSQTLNFKIKQNTLIPPTDSTLRKQLQSEEDKRVAMEDEKNAQARLKSKSKFSKNKRGVSTEKITINTVNEHETTFNYAVVVRYFADSYEVVEEHGKITKLYYEGNLIATEDLENYKDTIQKVITKAKA
jgi:beta-lactamase regulating signal transducer with metallopeptidase domain